MVNSVDYTVELQGLNLSSPGKAFFFNQVASFAFLDVFSTYLCYVSKNIIAPWKLQIAAHIMYLINVVQVSILHDDYW